MQIGVDLDEVLADTLSTLVRFHNDQYGTSLRRDAFFSYRFEEVWGGTQDEAIRKVHAFFSSPYASAIMPVEGSLSALQELQKSGHTFSIVTARHEKIMSLTKEWVAKHFPGIFKDIHFTNLYGLSGPKRRKADVCKEHGIDLLIEDDPVHVHDCANMTVLLLDRPWNRAETPPHVRRIFSWDDVAAEISREGGKQCKLSCDIVSS